MSFTEKDKDYLFALLENILKCLFIENVDMLQKEKDMIKLKVMNDMKKLNLIEDDPIKDNGIIQLGHYGNRPACCSDPDNPKHVCCKDCL